MRTKVLLGAAVALMLIVSVATIGSNMGFKISIPLTAGWSNFVSLPYYTSYTDAASLFADIPNVSAVSRWNNSTGNWEDWTGSGTNFAVIPGEAYVVRVTTTGNWIVVGSHKPALGLAMTQGYSNFIAVPYHTTATNAQALLAQIPNATAISRWNNATGNWEDWTGAGTNFPVTPGEGYVVRVSASASWTPAHY